MPGEDFVEFGRDMAESEKAVKILQDAGYAFLNCDNGTYDAWYWAHPPQYMPDNCNLADVEHIRQFIDIPVACAGRMDPVKAAEEIAAGRLDAVAIARQNLVDENWVTKIKEGREEEIRPCIRCHNGCFNFAKFEGTENIQSLGDSLHLARCALNPPTMQHNRYKIVPTKKPKKVAIIGGGVGGMECALVLKKRGHNPVIFEKEDKLGGLFLTASAMTFKENDKELLRWYDREIKKAGIEIRYNTEVNDLGTIKRGFDEIIVCTGSVPRTMPNIKGFEKTRLAPSANCFARRRSRATRSSSSAAASPPARRLMTSSWRASTRSLLSMATTWSRRRPPALRIPPSCVTRWSITRFPSTCTARSPRSATATA